MKKEESLSKGINWPDIQFPPINLDVLQSAYNFYTTKQSKEEVAEETYACDKGCRHRK